VIFSEASVKKRIFSRKKLACLVKMKRCKEERIQTEIVRLQRLHHVLSKEGTMPVSKKKRLTPEKVASTPEPTTPGAYNLVRCSHSGLEVGHTP
jgi:hypothetical protein